MEPAKKTFLILITLFILCVFFVSCDSSELEDSNQVVFDITEMSESNWVTINPSTTYRFLNIADDSLYSLVFSSDSNGREFSRDSGNSDKVVPMNNGKNILVQGEDGSTTAKGSELGASAQKNKMKVEKLTIANPKGDEALSIIAKADDFSPDVCDEWNSRERLQAVRGFKKEQFYFINFNTPSYKHLDKSRIFLVLSDRGQRNMGGSNWGLFTRGKGYSQGTFERNVNPNMYMYDFSDKNFINIYHEIEFYFTEDRWNEFSGKSEEINCVSSVLLVNPESLSYTSETTVTKDSRIFAVPKAKDSESYIMHTEGCDLGNVVQFTDKSGRDYAFAYCLDIDAENKEYLIGPVSEEIFFDLDYVDDKIGGKFSLRKANTKDKVKGAIELDSSDYTYETTLEFTSSKPYYHLNFPVFPKDGYIPSNLLIEVNITNGLGNEAQLDSSEVYFKAGHDNSVGSSGHGYCNDSSVVHKVTESDILQTIEIELRKDVVEPETVKLTMKISDGKNKMVNGIRSKYTATTTVDNSSFTHDPEFFYNTKSGNFNEIKAGDWFWYVMTEEAYNSNGKLKSFLDDLEEILDGTGIEADSITYRCKDVNNIEFSFETDSSGKSKDDINLVFVCGYVDSKKAPDFSELKPSDIKELKKDVIKFYGCKKD